ncbi:MAG TPA: hypothetical protein VLI92_04385 [Candidatus Saccharimonadales bacterium]|nr:hypothetical protein [Candidatus Saccharimonadales bacterium]
MSTFLKLVISAFLIFFCSFLTVYITGINKLSIQSEDTVPAMFIPVTLVKEGTLYADSYYQTIRQKYPNPDDKSFIKDLTPFYFRKVGSHYISAFPIITPLFALVIFSIPLLLGMTVNFANLTILAHVSAALIVSLSGGFFYLLLNNYLLKDKKMSVLLTGIYLFGTVNFALLSQSLWQHGTLELLTILGLIFLNKSYSQSKNQLGQIFLTSFFLGFAILSRPTALLIVFYLSLIFIGKHFERLKDLFNVKLLVYLLGFLPAILFFFAYNKLFYVSVANQGYADQLFSQWVFKFPEGFLGLWISPSKGLLIYSPVFIFSLVGLFLSFKRKITSSNFEYIMYGCIVVVHTLVLGEWKQWYGGWSFGYRMASDIIPFLVLLLIPYIQSSLFAKTKKLFYLLAIVSVGIQFVGIVFFDGIWHAAYDRGFRDTSWLWSIKNSEFVFDLRRILVKSHLLKKACDQCS